MFNVENVEEQRSREFRYSVNINASIEIAGDISDSGSGVFRRC